MNTDVMFSSENLKWATPPSLVADLATVFDFTFDLAADTNNVCERFLTKKDNFLTYPMAKLFGINWLNPPYGRGIGSFLDKAHAGAHNGQFTTIALVPARTDTAWWFRNATPGIGIVLIEGRLTFGSDEYWEWQWQEHGKKRNGAPFPSAFLIFEARNSQLTLSTKQIVKLGSYGRWMQPHDNGAYTREIFGYYTHET